MKSIKPEQEIILKLRKSEIAAIVSFLRSEACQMSKDKNVEDLYRTIIHLIEKIEKQVSDK